MEYDHVRACTQTAGSVQRCEKPEDNSGENVVTTDASETLGHGSF
jgi:hypothetical protein